jgi:DNA-binding YbaB/EbfC family protein
MEWSPQRSGTWAVRLSIFNKDKGRELWILNQLQAQFELTFSPCVEVIREKEQIMAKGFKGPKRKNPMDMMQQLQKLQEQIETTQAQLAEETVTVTAGGGAVTVMVTGDQRVKSVQIDPDLLEEGDVEMLQDLVLTAINSGLDKSREMAAERLGPLSQGLPF